MELDRILLGVAYYPEHDPEAEWERDARLMRELGLNAIRVGEFCWSRMQREDGSFTLDWLERLVDLFAAHEIRTILCTPTATPPAWAVDRHPDLPVVLPDGRKGLFGGRRHYSVFHEAYGRLSVAVAEALADRFCRHEGVVGWHIDNEVGSYGTIDCSGVALAAFHEHLARTYGAVEELNRRWGLIFWNQEVERFDQIPSPTEMMCTRNPQYLLAYNLFCLDGMADFILRQARAIRQRCGHGQWIVGSCTEPVSDRLFRKQRESGEELLDFVELNNYPELLPGAGQNAMRLDRCRGIDRPRRFLTLEQQAGSGYTTTNGLDPRVRRLWSWETLARGSGSVVWFHWRRFRTGCEWRLPSVVERDRRPRGVFRDLQGFVREVAKVEPILRSARVVSDVRILLDMPSALVRDRASEPVFWMEIQLPDGWQHRFPLWEEEVRRAVYLPLARFGLTVDFVRTDEDWDPGKPLVVPDLDLCDEALAARLGAFCEQGGRLIVFPGVGERNRDGAHAELPSPGLLGPLLGVALADYYPLPCGTGSVYDPALGGMTEQAAPGVDTGAHVLLGGKRMEVDIRHGEILEALDAEVIGRYAGGPCDGGAAITRRRIGRGDAVYLGAAPRSATAAVAFYRQLLPDLTQTQVGYRRVRLDTGGGAYDFIYNDSPAGCPLAERVRDVISDREISELAPYGVALIESRWPAAEDDR